VSPARSDAGRLLDAFARGTLLPPSADEPNTVELARAMAWLCGVDGLELSQNAHRIADAIGRYENYVFVLIDGLGMNLIQRQSPGSFLRAHVAMELRAVFPSSTAPALTSIATGCWPAEHAIPGWWTYLPDRGITATVLPFIEKYTKRNAREFGVTPESTFPMPVLESRMSRATYRVAPKTIAGSVYTRYSSSGADAYGYERLSDAVDAIDAYVSGATTPTYTYFYIPHVDAIEHTRGPSHAEVELALRQVSLRLEVLAQRLARRARIVATADHGVIEVPRQKQVHLRDNDPLLDLLERPPSCEPRCPAFHVREGARSAFEAMFRERWGGDWMLLTVDEAERLQLLGPNRLSEETRRRLGDYVAVSDAANESSALYHRLDTDTMIGFHGGLHPDEMRIPLIVA
jgi:hypothetical protein